jgi:hypothetical protein
VSVLDSEREWCLALLMVGGDCQRIYMLLVLMVYIFVNLLENNINYILIPYLIV